MYITQLITSFLNQPDELLSLVFDGQHYICIWMYNIFSPQYSIKVQTKNKNKYLINHVKENPILFLEDAEFIILVTKTNLYLRVLFQTKLLTKKHINH